MLLARVAEQLYWAARYMERAEDTARVVNEHTHLLVDLPTSVPLNWEPLLAIPGQRQEFDRVYKAADETPIITFLLADRDNPSSVLSSVVAARDSLRTTREVLPREAWQVLNDLYLYVSSHHVESVDRRGRGRFLDMVVAGTQRFTGIVSTTMSRDAAYQFLLVGRSVERADMVSRMLDVRAVSLLGPQADQRSLLHDELQWTAVLRSVSALQAYYRQGLAPVVGPATVDFLLHDPDFPGSIHHCLHEIAATVGALPRGEAAGAAARAALRVVGAVHSLRPDRLHDGLDDVQEAIAALHQQIESTYFPPPPPPPPPQQQPAVDVAEALAGQTASE